MAIKVFNSGYIPNENDMSCDGYGLLGSLKWKTDCAYPFGTHWFSPCVCTKWRGSSEIESHALDVIHHVSSWLRHHIPLSFRGATRCFLWEFLFPSNIVRCWWYMCEILIWYNCLLFLMLLESQLCINSIFELMYRAKDPFF